MKVFRVVYSLLMVALLAGTAHGEAPWGILRHPVENGTFSAYAIDNLLGNRPIRYTVSEKITPQEENIFKTNIHKWPADTLRLIQQSGRTQEFQDIIPMLERNVTLQAVPVSTPPDVYVDVTQGACGPATNGCFDEKGENPYSSVLVVESHRAEFEGTSLHEIGHYFGLADQYKEALRNSHREYSSPVNTTDAAIMQGHYETNGRITCDDADGFINLIDLRYSQRNNGQFSKRAQKGWKSLCPNSPNIYQNAKTVNRPALSVREMDDTTLVVTEYKNGTFQRGGMLMFPDDPLSIFTFSPGKDKVQRERNSPFIRSIHKTKEIMAEFANGKYAPRQVAYKVSFSYGKPFMQNGKKAVIISVQEFLDGREFNSRKVTVWQDGEVTGVDRLQLEHDLYIAQANDSNILLSFRNGISGNFSCQIHEMHQKIWDSYANTGHLTANGKEQTLALPPDPNSRAGRYWQICQERKSAIAGFYKNFYEPLFNTVQPQDIKKQIKKTLRRSYSGRVAGVS